MKSTDTIYVAGHTGLVGSAIVRKLKNNGLGNLVFTPFPEYDLRNQQVVHDFLKKTTPDYVFLAAAKVGGIHANNTYPAEFIYDNLMIQSNVIEAARVCKVKKLLFLGSSCIYPKLCPQPIKEEFLLTGALEKTNEAYALAKISGLKMCEFYRQQYGCDFIAAMPTNLYGPGDNFDLQNSHVLPAMLRKFHEAKIGGSPHVVLWGTGAPKREFLYVDDLADALLFLMRHYSAPGHINVGSGQDLALKDLADKIAEIVGYTGKIVWDDSHPDGTPRKLLDVSLINEMGWKHSVNLDEGIRRVYNWYTAN